MKDNNNNEKDFSWKDPLISILGLTIGFFIREKYLVDNISNGVLRIIATVVIIIGAIVVVGVVVDRIFDLVTNKK